MKKLVSLFIVTLMLSATVFASVPGDWALETVDTARKNGILDASEQYSYTAPINREDFCTFAMRTLTKCGITAGEVAENLFTDTENEDVVALYNLGVINGKSETTFAPLDNITREEAATILHRMCKTLGIEDVYFDYRLSSYAFYDTSEFSQWATEHIYNIYLHGIMTGVGNDKFAPKEFYTTEQAVATMVRLYNKYYGTNVEYNLFEDKLNAQMPKDENYMFSPLSVKMALAMAANGADGETRKEILEVTDIEDLGEFNIKSNEMIKEYSESDLLKLNIANSVWINKTLTSQRFGINYSETVKGFYDAETKVSDSLKFVDDVNSWVAEKTNDKITEIIEQPSYWAMLVNAIYFKGGWALEFDEALTAPDTFTNADGAKIQTDFMNQTNYFSYYENDGVKILEMPYKNRFYTVNENGETISESSDLNISMYAVISDYDMPIAEILNQAVNGNNFNNEFVKLSMPEFEINYNDNLNSKLLNMGMNTAFGNNADFRKMFTNGNMQIMDILHVTYIKVDEKFTEAAAVTGGGMGGSSSRPPEPIEFKLNKPFTFVIRDNTNGEILFMGRYAFAE